jgi:hypothetical protein
LNAGGHRRQLDALGSQILHEHLRETLVVVDDQKAMISHVPALSSGKKLP